MKKLGDQGQPWFTPLLILEKLVFQPLFMMQLSILLYNHTLYPLYKVWSETKVVESF